MRSCHLSLSLSLSLSLKCLVWGRLIILFCFLFLWIYILEFSIIIFVWKLGKCEKLVENMFSRAFLRTQPNTWKKFSKHFSECNEIPKNILYSENILRQAYHILNLIFSQFWLCVCVWHTWHSKRGKNGKKKRKVEDILVNSLETLKKYNQVCNQTLLYIVSKEQN